MTKLRLRRSSAFSSAALVACSLTCFAAAGFGQAADRAPGNAPLLIASSAETAFSQPSSSSLPDAPSAIHAAGASDSSASELALAGGGQKGVLSTEPVADEYAMVIQPGQTAPRISKRTEVISGIRDSFTPAAIIGWVASEGYSFATNGSPNYPKTGKGFAQGLGASAARATSENIFTESILAPILHEDPRYYRLGSGHNVFARLVYAGTRGIITRTDGGHLTLNIANLGGNLAGSALTPVYYPPLNQSATEVFKTFGGSVGGSALGFVVDEFIPDLFSHHHQ